VELASLPLKLFNFLEGAPIEVAQRIFGAAHPLVIFFDCEFFEENFSPSNDYFQSNLFLGYVRYVLEKIFKNFTVEKKKHKRVSASKF
jgi:hypothetical protein